MKYAPFKRPLNEDLVLNNEVNNWETKKLHLGLPLPKIYTVAINLERLGRFERK